MTQTSPLTDLDDRPIGPYRLRLGRVARTPKSGWLAFTLHLTHEGTDLQPPVIEGIYSRGGRGVLPWIEVLHYRPQLHCGTQRIDLAHAGRGVALFRALAGLLPPGGHLMLGCEDRVHRDSYLALGKGVPPATTALGQLLFRAGFPRVKFFDLAEGGWEGQQKLWAEKPLDADYAAQWRAATLAELRRFAQSPSPPASTAPCAARARRLLSADRHLDADH